MSKAQDKLREVLAQLKARPLRDALAEKQGDSPFLLQTASILLNALKYYHDRGRVHGSLTPQGVALLPEGRVKLLDGGSSYLEGKTRGEKKLARLPEAYRPPELLAGLAGDARCDLWQLGLILSELLEGKLPPAPWRQRDCPDAFPHGDENLRTFLWNLLGERPEDRYPDRETALLALHRLERGETLEAVRGPSAPRPSDDGDEEAVLFIGDNEAPPPPPRPSNELAMTAAMTMTASGPRPARNNSPTCGGCFGATVAIMGLFLLIGFFNDSGGTGVRRSFCTDGNALSHRFEVYQGEIEVRYETRKHVRTRVRCMRQPEGSRIWQGVRERDKPGYHKTHHMVFDLLPPGRYRFDSWHRGKGDWIELGVVDLPKNAPPRLLEKSSTQALPKPRSPERDEVDWGPLFTISARPDAGRPEALNFAAPWVPGSLRGKLPRPYLDQTFLRAAAFDPRGALWLGGVGNRLLVLEGLHRRSLQLARKEIVVDGIEAARQHMVVFYRSMDGLRWQEKIDWKSRRPQGATRAEAPGSDAPGPILARWKNRFLRCEGRELFEIDHGTGRKSLLMKLPSRAVSLLVQAQACFVVTETHGLVLLVDGVRMWIHRDGCSLAGDGRGEADEGFGQFPLNRFGRVHGCQGWDPASRLIAVDTSEGVSLWDRELRIPLRHALPPLANSPVFSPDGKHLAAITTRNAKAYLHLLSLPKLTTLETIEVGKGVFGEMRWMGPSRLLVSHVASSTPRRWKLSSLLVSTHGQGAGQPPKLESPCEQLPELTRSAFDFDPASGTLALLSAEGPLLGRIDEARNVFVPLSPRENAPRGEIAGLALLPGGLGAALYGLEGSLYKVSIAEDKAALRSFSLPSAEDGFWAIPPHLRIYKTSRRRGYVWNSYAWNRDGTACVQSHQGGWVVLMERRR